MDVVLLRSPVLIETTKFMFETKDKVQILWEG